MSVYMRSFAMLVIVGLAAGTESPSQEDAVPTRYGQLAVNGEGVLLFRGAPVDPPIQANARLELGKPFRIGESDVVLVKDVGGTACPFQYYFVTLSPSGASHTTAFGTCNEITSIRQAGDSIVVRMHGYRGPFEPRSEREGALRESHIFEFQGGAVAEITKPQHHP